MTLPRRPAFWAVAVVVIVLAGVAAILLVPQPARHSTAVGPVRKGFHGAPIPARVGAPDFRLRDEQGRIVRLSEQRGKVVLVAFLYTHCTDVCPIIAAQLDSVARRFDAGGQRVRVFAVSVDPKGDTPRAVRAYLDTHRLGPDFHFLLGTRTQLWPVWRSYDVAVAPEEGSDAIAHTAPVLLIDAKGRPRVYFQQPQHVATIVHDVKLLLRAERR